MREILFRGKQVFFNDWIEGTGIFNDGINTWLSFNEPEKAIAYGLNHKRVHAETIGQFTGLTGKNGKKIFEGDIVGYCWYDVAMNFRIDFVSGEFLAVPIEKRKDVWAIRISGQGESFEVIGNIHDNPELLENP